LSPRQGGGERQGNAFANALSLPGCHAPQNGVVCIGGALCMVWGMENKFFLGGDSYFWGL
jgi:hypothetical protein